ncbi:MAG: hypothetical protein HY654_12420 [Acidobacteria bacterium]|nr:hypothetical protein [Acidobacteriota bacterium]
MVPAALMGHDIDGVLSKGIEMSLACRSEDIEANPGVSLGALMACGASQGLDKLAIELGPSLESFGLWVEQLVAESTGKNGKGIVPIVGEPLARAVQPTDRVHVSVDLPTPEAIGGEFMRWEIATAAAGALLGVNPFDEPNVRQAKEATASLLEAYKTNGHLPIRQPDLVDPHATLTLSEAARQSLSGPGSWRVFTLLRSGDYLGLLVYLAPSASIEDRCRRTRADLARQTGCATMFGYGPRYLHSTGQLHKGGPNTGVFVIVTADPDSDLDVPGEAFTFGVLERAQAIGDYIALERAGRRVLHVHLPAPTADALAVVLDRLLEA